ncbi:hypothetical protein BU26DRAFT_268486 [Trematosphaeria pertusa]|uniref:Uncharacterized protein n=1 Tax=Trematosphaeria pertusa TaxID=390896 RepID=A0A6A6IM94_9PLEO|nr:uncharacterized protein BU26DRAFT_268486 [Trematosphaeria pertusa]KAF2250670.1 hypothetical protein BU26DRAFT_268486 [Trematosphaeria pertusa]
MRRMGEKQTLSARTHVATKTSTGAEGSPFPFGLASHLAPWLSATPPTIVSTPSRLSSLRATTSTAGSPLTRSVTPTDGMRIEASLSTDFNDPTAVAGRLADRKTKHIGRSGRSSTQGSGTALRFISIIYSPARRPCTCWSKASGRSQHFRPRKLPHIQIVQSAKSFPRWAPLGMLAR